MAGTSPQVIWNLSKGFFKRNNPVDTMLKGMLESIHNLMTFNSKMKLLKYKFMLAQQQLNNMESHLDDNPFEIKGNRIDRAF